jgi:hypothetical protein
MSVFTDQFTGRARPRLLDNFGVSGNLYRPRSGTPRSIVAVNQREEAVDSGGMMIESEELMVVVCAFDATTGINDPQPGDRYIPSGSSATFPYMFTGTVREQKGGMITLEFRRSRPVQSGGEQFITDDQ